MKIRACLLYPALVCYVSLGAAEPAARDPKAIVDTMKKVADWHLAQPPKRALDDWTYGAFYAGVSALAQLSDDSIAHDRLLERGRKLEWKPGNRLYDADDHCVAQTWLDLYLQHRDPAMLAPIQSEFDSILANRRTNDLRFDRKGARERWAWCDALFMGPPAWVRVYAATGDKKYLQFIDTEWRATSDLLYDNEEHLYYRDSTYFEKRETNGERIFWSRGNGWVLAGLARLLQVMPPEHPNRKFYQQQYREMAQKIASLQQPDGLWHSSLLDPASYPLKETSGSGFYTFALAWGINRGALDRNTFEPVVRKAWDALLQCVTPEGKLTSVQPIGADPKSFDPQNFEMFGAGAFLLAGSEIYRLSLADLPAAAYAAFMPQRKDDFAWENDRIGFRVYGPALEATGEITSGLDVWAKRTRKPIIEKWFYLADYHKDHGEGLDMYKVGPTRGCGGAGIWRNGKLYAANNFVSWRLLENGPSRAAFELTYAPYDADGLKVRETRRFSLETGSNLNRIENRFDWEGGADELQVVCGIVKRPGGGDPEYAKDGSWMAYWEPEQKGNGTIGCGVVMTTPARAMDTPDQAFLQTTVKRGQPLVYMAGAGWTKSGDFPTKESWIKYVSDTAAKRLSATK